MPCGPWLTNAGDRSSNRTINEEEDMTVKISGTFPKDLLAFNGLEIHRDSIVETEMDTGEDEQGWTAYAVVKLSVKQVARLAGGEFVPTVQIDHIEVMEGARVEPARRALLDTFKERTTDGVVNPTQGDLYDHPDSDFLRHGSGVKIRHDDDRVIDRDPYENPDEAQEAHHGVPVERVELPAEDVKRLPGETDRERFNAAHDLPRDATEEFEEYRRERATS
jgi:hypothetical protein